MPADKQWIGKYVFSSKGILTLPLRNWYHPPTITSSTTKPNPDKYYLRNFFLWMPRKMWDFQFVCDCKKQLRSRGIYNNVRRVLDMQDFYYIATEYLDCICGKTFIAWDNRMLDQLPYATQCKFPAALTYKYAVDKSLLTLLRSRTLGNSPSAVQASISELHSENWIRRGTMYMQDCVRHSKGVTSHFTDKSYDAVPEFKAIPKKQWFMAAYTLDVLSRISILKGNVTSVFGKILKIDSTKKIVKKLAGESKGSAAWATNIGNEYGGILQCAITHSESCEALQLMADGIMNRYSRARVEPPVAIYTDRDCCNINGGSKINDLFNQWPYLKVRLDIWHFMRRISVGCTSESHPLYSVFMGQLSGCIFEVSKEDYDALFEAKREELMAAGVRNPSHEAVSSATSKAEILRHCRRKTRGEEVTTKLIEDLILEFIGSTDVLGVPLFNEEMVTIWEEQKRHVACIQDKKTYHSIPRFALSRRVITICPCTAALVEATHWNLSILMLLTSFRENVPMPSISRLFSWMVSPDGTLPGKMLWKTCPLSM